MNIELLQSITGTHQWQAIGPEILLGSAAVLLLFLDLLFKPARRYIGHLAIGFQVLAILWILGSLPSLQEQPRILFNAMIEQDVTGAWLRIFFAACGIGVSHLGIIYLREKAALPKVEFHHLSLIGTACLMILVQAHHFILLFVALETLTIGFYILVAFNRDSRLSLEAGLKYLIMGAFSSGFLLFGIALLYGVAGNPLLPGAAADPFNFTQLAVFLGSSDELHNNSTNILAMLGVVLVLIGIAFKIGVVPFQIWIPDVYQGAPTPVTAFLAVSSKAGGFILLYILMSGPFGLMQHVTHPLLGLIVVLTIVFGNLSALGQRNVKRLMGLSGVAHAGILLLGILAAERVDWGISAVFFYLFTYALASFAVFEVMAHVAGDETTEQDLDRYDDLLRRDSLLGSVLVLGLGSLAGIPPLAGFVAKLLIFMAAFQAGLYGLLGVALAGVVVSIYYYFSWMRSAVMKNPFVEEDAVQGWVQPRLNSRLFMGLLATGTVLFGLYQGVFAF